VLSLARQPKPRDVWALRVRRRAFFDYYSIKFDHDRNIFELIGPKSPVRAFDRVPTPPPPLLIPTVRSRARRFGALAAV